jgi:hypothetical protein
VLPPLTAPNRQQRVYVCVSRAARAAERHHAAHLIGLLIVVGIPEMEIGVAKPPRVSRKKPLKKRQRAGCAPFFRRRENKTSVRNLPGPRRVGQHAAAASTCPAPRSHVRATPAPPPPPRPPARSPHSRALNTAPAPLPRSPCCAPARRDLAIKPRTTCTTPVTSRHSRLLPLPPPSCAKQDTRRHRHGEP